MVFIDTVRICMNLHTMDIPLEDNTLLELKNRTQKMMKYVYCI